MAPSLALCGGGPGGGLGQSVAIWLKRICPGPPIGASLANYGDKVLTSGAADAVPTEAAGAWRRLVWANGAAWVLIVLGAALLGFRPSCAAQV